jgi:hypothetical protein
MRSTSEKFQTVINNNTFYYFNNSFEDISTAYISSLRDSLLLLKDELSNKMNIEEIIEVLVNHIMNKDNGLISILALNGLSQETLKRIITIIRIVDDNELNNLVLKDQWINSIPDPKAKDKNLGKESDHNSGVSEWSFEKIQKLVITNKDFATGLINLFCKGSTVSFLSGILPSFELQKLFVKKLTFDMDAMIETLVKYKEKGSRASKHHNNAEEEIKFILEKKQIPYTQGDLPLLSEFENTLKRTMDFIIPDKINPLLIIESSFLATTSSGQGDKAKTELNIRTLIKKHYPNAHFIGFLDGIGWYVRKKDLSRMVEAYEDVFTFSENELTRFDIFLNDIWKK